jgi:class 3 adenylate cyclase
MQRSPEVEAVNRRFWRAFIERDRQAMANMAGESADVRLVLSADDEWIKGDGHLGDIMAARADEIGIVSVEFDRLEGFEHGDTGWCAASLVVHRDTGADVTFRQTATFIIEAGVWRVVQIHTSIGVPNEDSFGYEISKGMAQLLDSLDESSVDSVVSSSHSGTVTLMFTDIEGSTQMSEQLGDAAWSEMVAAHFDTIGSAVKAHGGTLVKTLGDGTMAAFPGAAGALSAAVDIQRSAAAEHLSVRVGVHTGDAVQAKDDYAGIAVNKAARIASAANGGEVLASSVTVELAGSHGFQFGPERSAELKGISGTHRLIPVIWESPPAG